MTPFQAHIIAVLQDFGVLGFALIMFLITGWTWVWVFCLMVWIPTARWFMEKYGRL